MYSSTAVEAELAGVALGERDERAAVAEPLLGRVDGDVLELEHVVGSPDHEDAEHTSARLADPYLAGCDEARVVRGHRRGLTTDARYVPRVGRADDCPDSHHVVGDRSHGCAFE